MTTKTIYKICSTTEWQAARSVKSFKGAAIDLADGYIHFSTATTVKETAARHFAGQTDLVLISVDAEKLGADLKWEVSRGGDLFPHLYADLTMDAVVSETSLPLAAGSTHQFPQLEE